MVFVLLTSRMVYDNCENFFNTKRFKWSIVTFKYSVKFNCVIRMNIR